MKTLWNETHRIDRFLSGLLGPVQHRFFRHQARQNPQLTDKIQWQEKTLHLIRLSGRRKLKKELRQMEAQLLGPNGDTTLKNQITQIWL